VTRVVSRTRPIAWVALLLACGIAAAGCEGGPIGQATPVSNGQGFVSGNQNTTYYPPGSRPASPAVSGTTLTGQRLSLQADRGFVVVLNFWGSWCAPCRAEAPALASLARHFQANQVRFVGVDSRDSVTGAQAFDATFGVGYPSLRDSSGQIALAFRQTVPPEAIPTTLLIDRGGRIAARVIGQVSYRGLRALIDRILAGRA
jgi:thiol-disulfide isomerase/thioredoxin